MTRRPNTSIVASPVLVGSVTVLIVIIAVVLAYNANSGLPFVPTLDVKVRSTDAAALGRGGEVREGGFRVGFVKKVRTVPGPDGRAIAEFEVKLDKNVGDLPEDTTFTIRPRSPLGLKLLEMDRGNSSRAVKDGHVFQTAATEVPVQVDDFNRTYDARTRRGVQQNLQGFGDALAGRGGDLNDAIADLPRVFYLLDNVAGNLAHPRTELGRFFREVGDAARVVSPLARVQSEVFSRSADTFEALSREPESLKQTIARSHPALQAGIESLPVQRPFLTDSAQLAREMQPVARDLRPALPELNSALEIGVPVVRRSPAFYEDLRPPLMALRDLAEEPSTGMALRGLTATATTLKPQLRYLGPYQTVCNSWNYFWTYLGEHVSQEGPVGFSQRAAIKSTGQQSNNPSSMGSPRPANGEGYEEASRSRGAPVHLHGNLYQASIDEEGNADCENGQRGYMRRLSRFADADLDVVTDPHLPGLQGPTFTGRAKVPEGQTFTREPETGPVHE